MPIFEYRCPRCGYIFEHFWRGLERREELRCPQCGEEHVEKLVSRFGTAGSSSSSSSAGASCAPSGGG
jgi:putative FmdB family regulatory protein